MKRPRAKSTKGRGKHVGGYIADREALERVALLRARLRVTNSRLLQLAIDALWRQHVTDRAWG